MLSIFSCGPPLAACISFFKIYLFKLFSHFLNQVGVFCCCFWVLGVLFYIVDVNPLSDIWFEKTFSPYSVGCLFTAYIVSFDAQNFQIFMKSNLSVLSFVACAVVLISKKSLPNLMQDIWLLITVATSLSLIVHQGGTDLIFLSTEPIKHICNYRPGVPYISPFNFNASSLLHYFYLILKHFLFWRIFPGILLP